MIKIYDNYYDICSQYKFLRLGGFVRHNGLDCDMVAAVAGNGSIGTTKDSVADFMLKTAAQKGLLSPKQPVVDYCVGSFASALTIAGLKNGHAVHIVTPTSVSIGDREALKRLGATVHAVDMHMPVSLTQYAQKIAASVKGYFVDYINNDDNPEFHRRYTGPQILKATDGATFDCFITGVSSGGTISGTAEYIKAWTNGISVVAVQPFESQVLTGGTAGAPGNYNPYIVDEVVSITTGAAKTVKRELLYTDGLPVSLAGGAAVAAAKEIATREQNPKKRFVIVL